MEVVMRKSFAWGFLVVLAALAVFVAPAPAAAQDPLKTSPDQFKVLFENEQVRVLEFTGKAGSKAPMHSHPDHVIYVVAGGKSRFTGADGKVTEVDSKAGDVRWNAAGSHASEALSDSKAILVELKKK
jgi:quercetin dioxygenase-like cupin family protein